MGFFKIAVTVDSKLYVFTIQNEKIIKTGYCLLLSIEATFQKPLSQQPCPLSNLFPLLRSRVQKSISITSNDDKILFSSSKYLNITRTMCVIQIYLNYGGVDSMGFLCSIKPFNWDARVFNVPINTRHLDLSASVKRYITSLYTFLKVAQRIKSYSLMQNRMYDDRNESGPIHITKLSSGVQYFLFLNFFFSPSIFQFSQGFFSGTSILF